MPTHMLSQPLHRDIAAMIDRGKTERAGPRVVDDPHQTCLGIYVEMAVNVADVLRLTAGAFQQDSAFFLTDRRF